VVGRARGDADRTAAVLPALEHGREVVAGGVDGEHLVREVLENDGPPRHPCDLTHDLGRGSALDGQLGEGRVHLVGRPQLGELGVDDARVHLLGHGCEGHLSGELDEDEPALLRGLDHRVGQPVEPATDLDEHAGDAGRGQPADVGGQAVGVVGEEHAGGEQQLAAVKQPRDVGDLGGVGPADRAPEVAAARAHDRCPGPEHGELEDLGHGRVDVGETVGGAHGGEGSAGTGHAVKNGRGRLSVCRSVRLGAVREEGSPR
jgi:hypothetical protein